MIRYYLDTCIWRDHYENRFGQKGRPLGTYATRLIIKIMKEKSKIIISDLVLRELKKEFDSEDIEEMFYLLHHINLILKRDSNKDDIVEARRVSEKLKLPTPDVLHAIIARNNGAILISQDKHFQELKDIVPVKKPEEVI